MSIMSLFRRFTSRMPALALAAVLPLLPLNPGAGAGALAGRVTDAAGNPVASAQVTVLGTGHHAQADMRGGWHMARIPAGTYTLQVSSAGFRRLEVTGVVVQAGLTTVRNLVLERTAPREPEAAAARDPRQHDANRALPTVTRTEAPTAGGTGVVAWPGSPGFSTEDYRYFRDNGFKQAGVDPLSTFAIDVDGASYANVRRFLTSGQRPPADAVRIEELVNYFPYAHAAPSGHDPFGVTIAQMAAPWAPGHRLVMVGIQGRPVEAAAMPPANLVFLIDVSGSMQSPDKLPLVKRAFRLLVDQLRPEDRVAIVVYAGAAGLVLPSTPGSSKPAIVAAIEGLEAGGSTAGGAGIRLAYDVARENFRPEGNNRVILASDGDFNVGVSSEGELVRLVEDRRKEGTFLTVLGFGTGNLKDSRMEALADRGNGHYAYVDDIQEARKVFVSELGGTLLTIARDVKVQVEFNPARVAEYRLIGYENRMLEHQEFNDDSRDGGELGAGHTVTALYEVVPVGVTRAGKGSVDPLKYQSPATAGRSSDLATVKLRYQPPVGGRSQLITRVVPDQPAARGTESLRFAAAVVEFGMLLRGSEYRGASSWEEASRLARANLGSDPGGYRSEFVRLLEVARGMPGVVGGGDAGGSPPSPPS